MGDNYLSDFLRLAEEFIVAIQQACDDDCADIDGIPLHTELLLRDVALVEEFVAPEIVVWYNHPLHKEEVWRLAHSTTCTGGMQSSSKVYKYKWVLYKLWALLGNVIAAYLAV